ncbi:hypothetical protein J7M28_09660 [bacterium]|nr:hypothetical protein [bacterium]
MHEERIPHAQCVFAHPDGRIYACFRDNSHPESRTYISRYTEGQWTEITDGGGYHCYITSDGTIWTSGIDYSDGLFTFEGGFWLCAEGFEEIRVEEITEAIGKIWILGSDDEPVLVSLVDGQDLSRLVLPSYAWNFAVSDDGALFFSN